MEGTNNSQAVGGADRNYQQYTEPEGNKSIVTEDHQHQPPVQQQGIEVNISSDPVQNESISVRVMNSVGSDLLILAITSTMVFLQAATSCVGSNTCGYTVSNQDKSLISYGEWICCCVNFFTSFFERSSSCFTYINMYIQASK